MNAPSLDEIDARLRSLPRTLKLTSQDTQAVVRLKTFRIEEASRHRHPARLMTAAVAALALFVFGNGLTAYYAPVYGRALAQVPVIGEINTRLLEFGGVTAQKLAIVNDSSTSSGHTVRIVAGYADGLRTVFFFEIDGKGLTGNPKSYGRNPGDYAVAAESLTLTDQFGHRYKLAGPSSVGVFQFEPLVWPASKVGARLTLRVTELEKLWLAGEGQTDLAGDWTLQATLVADPVHILPLPSPVRTSNAVYSFTSVRATPTALHIDWTVAGALVNDPRLAKHGTDAEKQLVRAYLLPRLFDATGNEMPSSTFGIEFSRPIKSDFNGYLHGPGRYRLQIGDALSAPAYEVWIMVP